MTNENRTVSIALKIRDLYSDKLVKTSSLLFVASMITNVSNYAFQIVMGRLLTTIEYGLMNALLALFTVLAVPVATLLMVVTRKTSEFYAKNDFTGISRLYRVTNNRVLVSGLIGLAVFIVCASHIRDYLHAPSIVPIVILGVSIFTTLAYPVNMAVLQGVQDYKWIGINQGIGGPTKLIFTVLFVLSGFGVNGVMTGLIASSVFLWFSSYYPIHIFTKNSERHTVTIGQISFSEVIPVFLAVFAFAILTQADVILSSRYFTSQDAGMYASAAILGKSVMYIPGAIVLAMFPMVSEHSALSKSSRHLLIKSLSITLCISGAGALLLYLFPGLIISIIYGARYHEAGKILKYYGLAMLPMALLMVQMNYLIAQGRTMFSYIMACGALLEITIILFWHDSQLVLVAAMLLISTILFIMGIIMQLLRPYSPRPIQVQ